VKEKEVNTTDLGYSFYSRVLNKPFDSVEELAKAEAAYYNELKAKEDKAAQKKADAKKVEDAFKALNAARKAYKEDLTSLTKEYSEELEHLKKAYELGKKDITSKLAKAEEAYLAELNEFTKKYDNYHMTLKGDDFETTISNQSTSYSKNSSANNSKAVSDFLDLLFSF
jgi:chromosome segregation ATPase